MTPPRKLRWPAIPGLLLGLFLLVVLWPSPWLTPIVENRASAALGRRVTIAGLQVAPGRVTRIVADNIEIANPEGFPADSRLATIDHLGIGVDIWKSLRARTLVIPSIDADHPTASVATGPHGEENWKLATAGGGGGFSPRLGVLTITDGHATVKVPALKADFAVDIATRAADGARPAALLVNARGNYAGQPIDGRFVGGALLSLGDATHPYPIDLRVANGQTRVTLVGTVLDPLAFKGTNIKLELEGPDMGALYPLTGIPIPETPPYHIAGSLSYEDRKIHFDHFSGTVGHSDLNGSVRVDPGPDRPLVDADLTSRNVDLADLGGALGGAPGSASTAETPEQKREHAEAAASPSLLPDTPFNLPKLRAADFRVKYRGKHIKGRSMPLDDVVANLTVTDGNIRLDLVRFGVGRGHIDGTMAITDKGDVLHTIAGVDFRQVDLARLLAATHVFGGAGTIGGRFDIDATGNSVARMMANGNGGLKLFMTGGDLSALLVSLAGLDFGDALAAALGLPNRTPIRCMVTDMPLKDGILSTRSLLLDTDEANVIGKGDIDFRNETINYQITQWPKHFTIGALPAPIDVRGKLKSPSILPDPAALAARGGIAAALGVVLTPLAALLPTIRLGLEESNDCAKLISEAARSGPNKLSPGQIRARTSR